MQVFAERWWASIEHHIYGDGQGRGPRIQNIDLDDRGSKLTLTFDKDITIEDWLGNQGSKAIGFRINDGETSLNDSNIISTIVKGRNLEIDLDRTISKSAVFSYASDNSGTGKQVIRDTSPYRLPTEPIFSYHSYNQTQNEERSSIPSPLQQTGGGIKPLEVECAEGFLLTLKQSDGSAACVTSQTMKNLVERNWAENLP